MRCKQKSTPERNWLHILLKPFPFFFQLHCASIIACAYISENLFWNKDFVNCYKHPLIIRLTESNLLKWLIAIKIKVFYWTCTLVTYFNNWLFFFLSMPCEVAVVYQQLYRENDTLCSWLPKSSLLLLLLLFAVTCLKTVFRLRT